MPGCTLGFRYFSGALALAFLCMACGGADREADGVPAGTESPPPTDAPAGLASAAPITDQELQSFRLTEDRLTLAPGAARRRAAARSPAA
jgi:hypothetical protein